MSDRIAVLMAKSATRFGLDQETLIISARAAVATVLSLLLARTVLRLPEFYWAPISTIVIVLSTINPLTLAWQRFVGTALGPVLGALIATYFHTISMAYCVEVFCCGILQALLCMGSAYGIAATAVTILLLVAHEGAP